MVAATDSEGAIGVRRETASGYLKEAGVALRPPGGWGRASPAKPANGVIADLALSKPAIEVITDSAGAKPFAAGGDDPAPGKTGHRSDHRLWRGVGCQRAYRSRTETWPQSLGQRLRTLPRCDRSWALAGPQRHGHLAGPGGPVRLQCRLSKRPALCAETAGQPVARGPRRDRDRAR